MVQRYNHQLCVSNHVVPKFFSWECTAIKDESFHASYHGLIQCLHQPSGQSFISVVEKHFQEYLGWEDGWISSDDPETLHRLCPTAALDPFNHNATLEVCFPLLVLLHFHKMTPNLLPTYEKLFFKLYIATLYNANANYDGIYLVSTGMACCSIFQWKR